MPVEDLQHPVRHLDNLEIPGIVFEHQQARYAQRIAVPLGVISQCRWNGSGAVRWLVGIELRVSPGCSGWSILAHGKDSVPSQPDSGKVARAEGERDRKSTRLNSSHGYISYAVFC